MGKGIKFDDKKLQWDLLPLEPIQETVKVLMHGAEKYAPDNWKYVEPWDVRYYNAIKRHLDLWWLGYRMDGDECGQDKEQQIQEKKKSGMHHLAHAICCLTFLYWGDENKKRTKKGMEMASSSRVNIIDYDKFNYSLESYGDWNKCQWIYKITYKDKMVFQSYEPHSDYITKQMAEEKFEMILNKLQTDMNYQLIEAGDRYYLTYEKDM